MAERQKEQERMHAKLWHNRLWTALFSLHFSTICYIIVRTI